LTDSVLLINVEFTFQSLEIFIRIFVT
jgi:hypothetical protein